jgi:hypothetical protein
MKKKFKKVPFKGQAPQKKQSARPRTVKYDGYGELEVMNYKESLYMEANKIAKSLGYYKPSLAIERYCSSAIEVPNNAGTMKSYIRLSNVHSLIDGALLTHEEKRARHNFYDYLVREELSKTLQR